MIHTARQHAVLPSTPLSPPVDNRKSRGAVNHDEEHKHRQGYTYFGGNPSPP